MDYFTNYLVHLTEIVTLKSKEIEEEHLDKLYAQDRLRVVLKNWNAMFPICK